MTKEDTIAGTVSTNDCEHKNQWYVTLKGTVLWIIPFERYYWVCRDCGEQGER